MKRMSSKTQAVLAYMRDSSPAGEWIEISKRELGRKAGCCEATANSAVRLLLEEGLIEMEARFDANGGQVANAYRARPDASAEAQSAASA